MCNFKLHTEKNVFSSYYLINTLSKTLFLFQTFYIYLKTLKLTTNKKFSNEKNIINFYDSCGVSL